MVSFWCIFNEEHNNIQYRNHEKIKNKKPMSFVIRNEVFVKSELLKAFF